MHWRNSARGYGPAAQLVPWLSVLFAGVMGARNDRRGSVRRLGELIHVSAGEPIGLLIFRLGCRGQGAYAPASLRRAELLLDGRQSKAMMI